jgi:hypothetical protein
VIADVEVDRAGFGQRRIAPRCQTKQAAKGRAAVELEVGRQDEHDQLFIRLADEHFGAAG